MNSSKCRACQKIGLEESLIASLARCWVEELHKGHRQGATSDSWQNQLECTHIQKLHVKNSTDSGNVSFQKWTRTSWTAQTCWGRVIPTNAPRWFTIFSPTLANSPLAALPLGKFGETFGGAWWNRPIRLGPHQDECKGEQDKTLVLSDDLRAVFLLLEWMSSAAYEHTAFRWL